MKRTNAMKLLAPLVLLAACGQQPLPSAGTTVKTPNPNTNPAVVAGKSKTAKALSVTGADVLILASSVNGGAYSQEAQATTALGLTYNIVSDSVWASMTTADFASYKAVVVGDPTCETTPPTAAVNNAATWGSALNGNVFIIGSDPSYHGKTKVIQGGIGFAAATPGKTGAYITLSCDYVYASSAPVPMLAGLSKSSLGSFTASGAPGCFDDAYQTANSPALIGIDSAYLSGWSCSVHEVFNTWPSDFEVLAIARNSGSAYSAPDGTVGTPYILARGNITVVSDITLTPDSPSHTVGTSASLTAHVATAGTSVRFTVVDGPNAGKTATVVTDASGNAVFTYSSTVEGTDGIRASFTDASSHTQTSTRVPITWSIPANTPPTAPGKPTLKTGSVTPNNTGGHTLTWAAASDAEGNALTYALEHKNAQGAGYTATSPVAGSALEQTLAETEGTWTYRVKANDGTADGPFSPESDLVKVDKTAPTAPSVQVNSAAPTGTWYKDSAAVTFSGSSDPVLADTSAGSGVASYLGAQTFTASGTFNYSGTATDAAGNVSGATTGSVKVDATAPTVAFASCPTSVSLGSAQNLSWTASDGQSGLSSAASGSVTLPTSTVGPKTVTTTATDAVGHTTTASCTVNVTYAFRGFLAPVDNLPIVNTAKAGSAVPLKFSLSGNQGLNILAAGSPTITNYACAAGAPSDDLGTLATFSNSGLQYDATSDTYNYVWKTDKTMIGCYQVNVKLIDGTSHPANFQLR